LAGMTAIEIQDLSYTYPDGRVALRGVNLRVADGDVLGLVGPNGAGKSTLLLHCNGLLSGQGVVRIFGEPITAKTVQRIRRRVGLVFQDPDDQLFMPRVFDDVAFGLLCQKKPAEEVRRRVAQALAQVGLAGFQERFTHHLSLGERKRVAIATVLVLDCDILLLDEPTANLDPRGRREFEQLLAALPQAKVIASHDLGMIQRLCTHVALLDNGRIVASGPAAEVLAHRDLLEAHGLQDSPASALSAPGMVEQLTG